MPDRPQSPEPWAPPSPLPEPLETQRLTIRFWRVEDAEGLFEAADSSRDTLLPWLDWAARDLLSVDQTRASIARFADEASDADRTSFNQGVFDRETGRVLGSIGMHRFNRAQRTGEVGYWLRADARGRGLMTEAVRHLFSSAFTPQPEGGWGLRRIIILSSGPNDASQRIPIGLGLRKELTARAGRWIDTLGWCDTHGWGVLEEEWDRVEHRLKNKHGPAEAGPRG